MLPAILMRILKKNKNLSLGKITGNKSLEKSKCDKK
jgi:hypothetical protein